MQILPTSFDLLLKGHVTYVIECVQMLLSIRLFRSCVDGKQCICIATALLRARIWAVLKPIRMGRGEMEARDAARVERPSGGRPKATKSELETCPGRVCRS